MLQPTCIITVDKSGLELNEHGNTSFPVAYYQDDFQTLAVPWHWHDELELIIVLEGTAIIAVDGEQYHAQAGEGFFINSGALHSCQTSKNESCQMHSIVFHPRFIGGWTDSIFYEKYLNPILKNPYIKSITLHNTIPWQKTILDTIEATWHCCKNKQDGYEFRIRSMLSEIIYQITCHSENIPQNTSEQTIRNSTRIKTMLQFIETHYAENLT